MQNLQQQQPAAQPKPELTTRESERGGPGSGGKQAPTEPLAPAAAAAFRADQREKPRSVGSLQI
jgi:hypothetical protein